MRKTRLAQTLLGLMALLWLFGASVTVASPFFDCTRPPPASAGAAYDAECGSSGSATAENRSCRQLMDKHSQLGDQLASLLGDWEKENLCSASRRRLDQQEIAVMKQQQDIERTIRERCDYTLIGDPSSFISDLEEELRDCAQQDADAAAAAARQAAEGNQEAAEQAAVPPAAPEQRVLCSTKTYCPSGTICGNEVWSEGRLLNECIPKNSARVCSNGTSFCDQGSSCGSDNKCHTAAAAPPTTTQQSESGWCTYDAMSYLRVEKGGKGDYLASGGYVIGNSCMFRTIVVKFRSFDATCTPIEETYKIPKGDKLPVISWCGRRPEIIDVHF